MAFMVWNDRLMTGIAAIDGDHRKLVDMINELYEAIREGRGHDAVHRVLDRLVEYTRFHFGREEALLNRTGYPGLHRHKAQHDGMVAWVAGVQANCADRTAAGPSLEVMNYLKDWLFDHILGSDQHYVAHLRATGVR